MRAGPSLAELAANPPRWHAPSRAKLTAEQRREVYRRNWSRFVEAFTSAPPEQRRAIMLQRVRRRGQTPVMISWAGETLWIADWARRLGLTQEAFRSRCKAHMRDPQRWPMERVMARESMGRPTLGRERAEQLRADRRAGATYGQLVSRYGITKSAVRLIVTGRAYK